MTHLVRTLKALSDPTRLRLVDLLRGRDDLCVCELTDALDIPQYSVSRHLGVLKAAGLVTDWRQGKWMHYALNPKLSQPETHLLAAACDLAAKDPAGRHDRRRLKRCLRPRMNGEVIACD